MIQYGHLFGKYAAIHSVRYCTELTKALLIGYYRQQGVNWDSGLEYLIE